jgi:hypothetical protein
MVPDNGRHFGGLPIIVVAALGAGYGAANVAAAYPQFHPGRAAAAIL